MTRRCCYHIGWLVLVLGIAPGCASLATLRKERTAPPAVAAPLPNEHQVVPQLTIADAPMEPAAPAPQAPPAAAAIPTAPKITRADYPSPTTTPPEAPRETVGVVAPVQATVPLEPARLAVPLPVGTKPEPQEPLVLALAAFLRQQPEEALRHLQRYDRSNQEMFVRVLPLLAELTQKKLDSLSSQEASAWHDQLQGLLLTLRTRADLIIETMCFCQTIEGYGMYTPWPEEHVFRPRSGDQLGELVQVYVQLRNLTCERCANGCYETKLASAVEIRDIKGERVWYHDFQDRQRPLCCQTLRQDYFNNYSFYVPRLPAGSYSLIVRVRDLSRAGCERLAERTLPFRVGP